MRIKDFLKVYSDMLAGVIRKNEETKKIEKTSKGRILNKHEMRYSMVHTFSEEFNHLIRLKQHRDKDFKAALIQIDCMYVQFYRKWKKLYRIEEKTHGLSVLNDFENDKRLENGEDFLREDFQTFMLDAFKNNKKLSPLAQEAFK